MTAKYEILPHSNSQITNLCRGNVLFLFPLKILEKQRFFIARKFLSEEACNLRITDLDVATIQVSAKTQNTFEYLGISFCQKHREDSSGPYQTSMM